MLGFFMGLFYIYINTYIAGVKHILPTAPSKEMVNK